MLQRASAHGAERERRARQRRWRCRRACKHHQLLPVWPGALGGPLRRSAPLLSTETQRADRPLYTYHGISKCAEHCAEARRKSCDRVTPAARLNVRADWVALQACVAALCAHDRAPPRTDRPPKAETKRRPNLAKRRPAPSAASTCPTGFTRRSIYLLHLIKIMI